MDYSALAKQFGGTEESPATPQDQGYGPFMNDLSIKDQNDLKLRMQLEGRKRLADLSTDISSATSTMSDLEEFGRLNRESSTGSWWQQLTPDKSMFRNQQSMEMAAIQARLGPSQRVQGSGSSSDRDVSLFLRGLPSTENDGPTNAGIREDFERKYKYATDKRAAMQGHLDNFGHLGGFDAAWSSALKAKEERKAAAKKGAEDKNLNALLKKYQ